MDLSLAFNWVIKSSIMASIFAVLILLIKYVLRKKLDARWQYALWMLLMIRLLIPYDIQSPWSIYSLFLYNSVTIPIVNYFPDSYLQISNISGKDNKITNNRSISNQQSNSDKLISKNLYNGRILTILWLGGAFILTILTIITNLKFYLRVRQEPFVIDEKMSKLMQECTNRIGIRKKFPLIITNQTNTPCLCGIFSPKLLLPKFLINRPNEENLRHIFLHELSHYKRKDILINWLAVTAQIVHWFNPIIWYSFSKMREDCELACDASTLSLLTPEEYQSYGFSIINLLTPSQSTWLPGTAGFFGNKNNNQIKRRIKMIKLFQKPTMKWTWITLVIFISLGLVGFTSSISNGTPKKEVSTETQTPQSDQAAPASTDSQIPEFGTPGSILSVDFNLKLQTVTPGVTGRSPSSSSQNQSSSTHMPKMEPGMIIVYDGTGSLMKITSANHSIYYCPQEAYCC